VNFKFFYYSSFVYRKNKPNTVIPYNYLHTPHSRPRCDQNLTVPFQASPLPRLVPFHSSFPLVSHILWSFVGLFVRQPSRPFLTTLRPSFFIPLRQNTPDPLRLYLSTSLLSPPSTQTSSTILYLIVSSTHPHTLFIHSSPLTPTQSNLPVSSFLSFLRLHSPTDPHQVSLTNQS